MMQEQPSESVLIQTLFEMSGITEEVIVEELKELLREASKPIILFWDIDDMVRATSYGKTFLEEIILCDPRVKQYERQRGHRGKRVWLAQPTAKAIQEIIMNEWD